MLAPLLVCGAVFWLDSKEGNLQLNQKDFPFYVHVVDIFDCNIFFCNSALKKKGKKLTIVWHLVRNTSLTCVIVKGRFETWKGCLSVQDFCNNSKVFTTRIKTIFVLRAS